MTRLASATISSERLFSKLEGLSAIARVEPGAKIAALQPFPTGLTSMRCPLYSIAVIAHRGSVHFRSAPRLKHGARNLESFPPPRLALGLPPRGQIRDRMRLGELIGKAIHEACHRQKENCSSDSDRHQPGECHSPVVPIDHGFLPYANARGLLATQRAVTSAG